MPRKNFSIHGDKDQHLPCASVTLRLEQMPDIILCRDCTLLSFYHSLIVVLDRTVSDFYIASLRCRTSNSRVAERCATGDGCPHLTTEHGHSMSQQVIQSTTGIKTAICPAPALLFGLNKCRTLSCSGIALSFLFSYCHFLVSPIIIMMPFSKVRHFGFQCCPVAFLNIGEAIFI